MKKFYILLVMLASITSVSAQHGRNNDYRNNDNRGNKKAVVMNHGRNHQSGDWDNRYDNKDRRRDIERQREMERINRDYDRRVYDYRHNRSMSCYERDRRIAQMERERQARLKSFTGVAVVGAVAGVILGVLIAGK